MEESAGQKLKLIAECSYLYFVRWYLFTRWKFTEILRIPR